MRAQILISTALAFGGTVLSGPLAAQTLTTIQSWNGSTGYAFGRPYVSTKGVLYGVLSDGVNGAKGTVYSLTKPKTGTTWTAATISSFTGGATGGYPLGGLVADLKGNLYGTSFGGGDTSGVCSIVNGSIVGCGTVYELVKPKTGTTWTRKVLYSFTGGKDGIGPVGDLVFDAAGALYGVTEWGGCTPTLTYPNGCGTVFKLSVKKKKWTETVLHDFQGGASDGAYPSAPVAVDASGNVYGGTLYGGLANCNATSADPDGACGTAFELTKSGNTYSESVLYKFADGADGSLAGGGVLIDANGNLFGTTLQGGNTTVSCQQFGHSGCGTVFELSPPTGGGTAWTKTAVHTFTGTDGAYPEILLKDAAGNLFGTASENSGGGGGCAFYCGTVFALKFSAGVWTESTLHSFLNGSDNAGPQFGLTADSVGTLYGVSLYNVTSTAFTLTGSGF
jgi:hypothetical protein